MYYFGVDYYPEHWPEERWPVDARLMAEAGMNVVRLAEFAWSKMEPSDGNFAFEWLDRAIDILAKHEIRVILGTPTASPPPWLVQAHPGMFRVREDGRRLTYGNRREYCPSHPEYQEYSQRIVQKMADHYHEHPSVIGWQIDNEFGDRCYCPVCMLAFQDWLSHRYQTLDELNQKWGTVFWSHGYNDWKEIPVPVTTGGSPNPGLALDFYRFSSDSYVTFQKQQVDILRSTCPSHFITHNFMGFKYDRLNYFDLAKDLDLVSWDNYPRTQWNMAAEANLSFLALGHDTMRGLKARNFWMMEQQAGPGGWESVSVMPRPGELRLWAYQAVAHGADGMIFFRWRTARFGTEQYWHGLLDHDGTAGRRYTEIKQMGGEIKKLSSQVLDSKLKPQVAMLLSYDSRFAFQIQANNPQFDYRDHFHAFYSAIYKRNILVDIVNPMSDLHSYKLVIVPALHVLPAIVADNLRRFVEEGGVLVLTMRSGVKDESNMVVNSRLPGILAGISGVTVEEYDSLGLEMNNAIEFTLPEMAKTSHLPVSTWCDILKPSASAEVIAKYTQDYYAGRAAITRNKFKKGWVVYIGTIGEAPFYDVLASWLVSMAGVKPVLDAPEGVEVTERWQGERRLLFLMNYSRKEQEITLDGTYTDLLINSKLVGKARIAPLEVRVLAKDKSTAELR
jgi:beta-galactosidase